MPSYIDVDAFIKDVTERYCKDCERRKGIKNGKQKFIYDIGDAPCRACTVDDMMGALEDAPTVDAVEVVRCRDCKKYIPCQKLPIGESKWCDLFDRATCEMNYCGWGERREG